MSESTIKERPILFSGPMVRAILAGRKTQTRRVVNPLCAPSPGNEHRIMRLIDGRVCAETAPHERESAHFTTWGAPLVERRWVEVRVGKGPNGEGNPLTCPYGNPGELLWVRESWAPYDSDKLEKAAVVYRTSYDESRTGTAEQQGAVEWFNVPHYVATEFARAVGWMEVAGERWRPSIHMPRWASRLTLEITAVRVERLQEISEADAIAEGFEGVETRQSEFVAAPARIAFRETWDALNAKRGFGWEANPWVWCVGFRIVQPEATA